MIEMTITDFAKNLKSAFDMIEFKGEEIVLIRNRHKIARIIPGTPHMTALEALSDLYRTLPDEAAESWLNDSKTTATLDEIRDPWE